MRRILVVGCGKRVVDAALPALHAAHDLYELHGIAARRARDVESNGRTYFVKSLTSLGAREMAEVDVVYVAVGKPNVPAALAALRRFDLSRITLLIETPILLWKHFRFVPWLRSFESVWVAEDCVELPWYDVLRAAAPSLGAPRKVEWRHSAYAYHGIAMSKAVLGARRVLRAVRRWPHGGPRERRIEFESGLHARVLEPRDYASGSFYLTFENASVADRSEDARGATLLTPVLSAGSLVGFRLGGFESRLDDREATLVRGGDPGLGVVARMESLKRVGLLRLLRRLAARSGGYPLESGLEDMVVDYALERFGGYLSTPLTNPRSLAANTLFHLLSSLVARTPKPADENVGPRPPAGHSPTR